ncbi:MAG: heavy-metal-associated domain-containing protein [Flavobacteriaceae bacterium]|nr:heavy-metal-associated domain-containing protein [Flavobacteriaceae bacterium]
MKLKRTLLMTILLLIGGNITMKAQQLLLDASFVKMEIKGMACPFCAGGMGKSFEAMENVQKVDMAFDHGLAFLTVNKQNVPTKEELERIVKKAGFNVGEILYSEEPFEIPVRSKKKKKKKNKGT